MIAFDPDGDLCVYQLKGGQGKLTTGGVDDVQKQLFTASATSVEHPSLGKSRRPDRVYLVTNQAATGPAQGQIKTLSTGNLADGLPPIQLIEKAELLSRFVDAEDRLFPSAPEAIKTFLALFLADGRGPVPVGDLLTLLEAILPVSGKTSAAEAQRHLSAAALTVAFALRPWTEADNHAEVAIGWILYCSQLLRVVQRTGLGEKRWLASYGLGLQEARRRLVLLLNEANEALDLALGHSAEPIVYGARATKVCGLVSGLLISSRHEPGYEDIRSGVHQLLRREAPFMRIATEAQAPFYFLTVLGLSRTGLIKLSTQTLFTWIATLCAANRPDSTTALPSPYYSPEKALLSQLSVEGPALMDWEEFHGYSYTLHVGIRWAARRLWRQHLSALWTRISRIEQCVFEPEHPIQYFYHRSPAGQLRTFRYAMPTSWAKLLEASNSTDLNSLPSALVSRPEFMPFFALAFPHRFTPNLADAIDEVA